jgi:hypothetical protein
MIMAKIVKNISVPLSGAPHAPPTTSDSKLSIQNVSLSSVIIPGVPTIPTCITLSTLSPAALSSTDLQSNLSLTAPHTPNP